MNYKHDLCIVGLKCYDLLSRAEIPRYLGGIERVLVSLARGLTSIGKRVAFITFDHGQPDIQMIDGITILKAYQPDEGIKGLRFVHPRMTTIWSAMRVADAEAYLQMGAGVETGVVAFGAQRLLASRRKFIFCIASDANCNSELPSLKTRHEKLIYRLALKASDKIVCQTNTQKSAIRKAFNVDSTVIPMPFQSQSTSSGGELSHDEKVAMGINILWVGRVVEVKRLEAYLSLAKSLPSHTFHIVGSANTNTEYARELIEQAKAISNIIVHGRISDEMLVDLYKKAFLLCCTSTIEGFPTTFLEAWSYKLPIITTFDPDGLLADHRLGVVTQADNLKTCIEDLAINATEYNKLSENGLNFYQNNYTVQAIAPRYVELING